MVGKPLILYSISEVLSFIKAYDMDKLNWFMSNGSSAYEKKNWHMVSTKVWMTSLTLSAD